MTVLAAVAGGVDVLALACDGSSIDRDLVTGEYHSPRTGATKLYPLSARLPLAAGTFGMHSSSAWPMCSVSAALERCRAHFDSGPTALPPTYTMREVAERVGLELWRTFAGPLADIGRRAWPVPADLPAGAHAGGSFVGGLVAGYAGDDGPPECWFVLVTAAGVAELVPKFRGGPGRWGVAVSPGAAAAASAYREIVCVVPRTLADAGAMARDLIQTEIDAVARHPVDRSSAHYGSAAGPVTVLALSPGGPARPLEAHP